MFKLILSLTVLTTSFSGFATNKDVFDQCSGTLSNVISGEVLGSVKTKITGDVLSISNTSEGKTKTAKFKIQDSSSDSYSRSYYINAVAIKNDIPSIKSLSYVRFKTDFTLYYGNPEAALSLRDKNYNTVAVAVLMSCKSTKSPNQNIKFSKN